MGYPHPAPLTPQSALTSWQLNVFIAVVVLLLGVWYVRAVRRIRRDGERWPRVRVFFFLWLGLGSLVVTTMSFIGVYQDVLFSVRAVQVIVLLMVTSLALALGAPITLLMRGGHREHVERLLHTRSARVLTHPAMTSVLLMGTPWLLYFTAWYPAALRNGVVDESLRLVLLAVGFLYFWSRLQLDPVPVEWHPLVALWITLVEVLVDAALGLVLWLGTWLVAADYYTALGRSWGPDLRTDQILGAGALWIIGDLAGLPFVFALVSQMARKDDERAVEIDRVLDEAEEKSGPTRLWWEDDPVLSERLRREL